METSMNHLSHAIRNFNRFELKYLLTLQQAEDMKVALKSYLLPDEHGKNHGRYAVTSLYYDSPDLRCYREKQDGLRFRRKLRIRLYGSGKVVTEETTVFLEIKQRVDRVTQKRRAVLPYADVLRLCNDRHLPQYGDEDQELIEEVFAFLWRYNLQPASIVRYNRQAFIGTKYDIGLRITFDTDLTFQNRPLHLHEQRSSLPMLPVQWVVMEIKVNDRIPRWLTDIIAAHNLQLQRISKYCRSIDAARNMLSFRWRHALPERTREVLSSSPAVFNLLDQKSMRRS
jgi:SPX domain protein involved in polyphosphate accumulation